MFSSTGHRLAKLEDQMAATRDRVIRNEAESESHYKSCVEYNERFDEMLTEGRVAREEQHRQGQEALKRLENKFDERINDLSKQIAKTIIIMLATVAMGLAGALYAIFAHKYGLS